LNTKHKFQLTTEKEESKIDIKKAKKPSEKAGAAANLT
jgi:hypothetical protein